MHGRTRTLLFGVPLAVLALITAGCTSSSAKHATSSSPSGTANSGSGSGSAPGPSGSSGSTGASGSSSGTGGPITKPTATGGAEGVTPGAKKPCPITSSAPVGKAFGAKAVTYTATTSPLGKPLCTFKLAGSNIGGARGTVVTTADGSSSRKTFDQVRKQVAGSAPVTHVGDAAFYVNDTGTLQFIKGTTSVVVQATFDVKAGTKYAAHIRSDVLELARAIAAQI